MLPCITKRYHCFIQTTCCMSKLVTRLNCSRLSTSSYSSWNFSSKALATIARLVLKVGVRYPFSTENNSLCKCIAFTCWEKNEELNISSFCFHQLGASGRQIFFLEIMAYELGVARLSQQND